MSYQWNDVNAVYVKTMNINYNHDNNGNFNQMGIAITTDTDIPNTPFAQTLYNGIINAVNTYLASNTDYQVIGTYTHEVVNS